jgi:peroxiredoxin
MRRCAIAALLLFAVVARTSFGGADEDWAKITELEAGPRGEAATDGQARSATIAHLAVQRAAHDDFLKNHPDDPRTVDVRLRLAHLLAVRADALGDHRARAESGRVLEKLLKDPALPRERVVDVEFAKIALHMRRMNPDHAAARESLEGQTARFEARFPDDRRVAALLVELATLYDSQPPRKQALLDRASRLTKDPDLQRRIADDLRRIKMLGATVDLKFRSVQGEDVDAGAYRGRVVVVCFFADWSPPSMQALERVRGLEKKYARDRVQLLGVSLDQDRAALDATIKARGMSWPVAWDGLGWESPLVRLFGINTLPTVWVLDTTGSLRALNAANDCEIRVRELLKAR